MKILIPTDFFKLSKVAVQYAVKISKKLNAELILLHTVYFASLAMFTHDLNFFEKLFGRSVTHKMAFQSWIPLLTFKKEKNTPSK